MAARQTADLQDLSAIVFNNTSTANTLTAAGTNLATAVAITRAVNRFTTVGASTGAALPPAIAGRKTVIFNAGANALRVYGNKSTDTIDGVAGSTGVPLSAAARAEFYCLTTGVWVSALLGAVSA